MDEPDYWHPGAAYLYVLHLDCSALAWEYLRRHPDYRRDWRRRRRRPETAKRWGLHLLENPGLDAREVQPAWISEQNDVVQVYPDIDPHSNPQRFAFWRVPGHKQLIHDGRRLVLASRWAGGRLHLIFAPGLTDGMACAYAVRVSSAPCSACRALAATLEKLATHVTPLAIAAKRPSATALLELHTLQALDGSLAGASLRTVAQVLFGVEAIRHEWHADSALRARVRRLIRRGRVLMDGGYRQLARLPCG